MRWYTRRDRWRHPVTQLLWGHGRVAGLRLGVLLYVALCRSGVRTKPGINMVSRRELQLIRLINEGRSGRGRKRSRQKSPCQAVVGSRPWIVHVRHSVQYNRTPTSIFTFFFFVLTSKYSYQKIRRFHLYLSKKTAQVTVSSSYKNAWGFEFSYQ